MFSWHLLVSRHLTKHSFTWGEFEGFDVGVFVTGELDFGFLALLFEAVDVGERLILSEDKTNGKYEDKRS